MDFSLSETEEMVRASAREFLSREAGPDLARVAAEDSTRAKNFWSQVCEMGWPGLAVSEDFGGAGMGVMPLAVLMEQWGAHIAPGPLFESAVLAAPLIGDAASDRIKRELLPGIADGSQPVSVAALESGAVWLPEAVRATAVSTPDGGWAVTGVKHFVTYADTANRIITAARTSESPADVSLFVIDPKADGVTLEPVKHASRVPVYAVSLNETPVSRDHVIGEPGAAWPLISKLMLRGAAFRAVQLAGLGQAVLDITAGYVKERKQFGRPVGSFQAIQHLLADMAVAVKSVRHQAYRAVWAVAENSPGAVRDVARAKYAASRHIPAVCWQAHQAFGAIGFTWEHDLHLHTRHALTWRAEFGDAAWHNRALAEALGL